ncbi:MAG: MBOAT family protein [Polyangiaceae bacterium]|nr:MBOAT family protein [Polyangiaceae bacterium]
MFGSSYFWIVIAAAAVVMRVVPARMVRIRSLFLCFASCGLLVGPLGLAPSLLALVCACVAWIVVGVRLTGALAKRSTALASFAVFSPILILWVVGKAAVAAQSKTVSFLYFVGFSYLVVKAWTFVKDVHDGRIRGADPTVVAAYFLFAPTYVSGPMHLFSEFDAAVRQPKRLTVSALVDGTFRVAIGFAKTKLLGPLLAPASLLGLHGAEVGPMKLVVASMVYSVVLWADFSGYSDIAIGSARLAGVETPENFRWPYAAPNIREFWQRWHITFSRVLTSYVFVPVARALQGRLGARPRLVAVLAYLVTFLFCGYWHGATLNFVLWGLYHGVGMIGYDLLKADPKKLKRLSPRHKRARSLVMAFCTFVFVSIGWVLFVLPYREIVEVLR